MTFSGEFVSFAGSVTGREHRRALRDGQDGFAMVNAPSVIATVVTDGCGSGAKSEVGARLGAAWLATLVEQRFGNVVEDEADARRRAASVTASLIGQIEGVARTLAVDGRPSGNHISDMLLFSFLAAVVTPQIAIVFGVGDGMVWIDGTCTSVDPGPDNAPSYAAYALVGAHIEPRIFDARPTESLHAVAIATDGAAPLIEGGDVALSDLVRDPRLDRNPSLLRKRLVVLADRGLLTDDTTIGIVRRTAS